MLKLGLIREWKQPADRRVVLAPSHCKDLLEKYVDIQIFCEPSNERVFPDIEYKKAGVIITDDLSDCDILLGVKEVPPEKLIPNKTYFFFSHVIKMQPYNRPLMIEMLKKKITMIDFESLVNNRGLRLIGFGEFAGIIGSYNGLLAWGKKTKTFELTPAYKLGKYDAILKQAKSLVNENSCRIVVTGSGRVANGAVHFLNDMGAKRLQPDKFLEKTKTKGLVFTKLHNEVLFSNKITGEFKREEFFKTPEKYKTNIMPWLTCSDMLINGIFWNERIPRFFDKKDVAKKDFAVKVIADVSCDINGSIPITVKDTSIADPVYGWDRKKQEVTEPYLPDTIDIMAVSNLPTELPYDASVEFGNMFCKSVLPELFKKSSVVLDKATICTKGKLGQHFAYLKAFVDQE
jgi:saccharopine dehydrogenase (NAD+, L-lysine forming)